MSALISPALLIPTSNTAYLWLGFKSERLKGTPKWLLYDFGEQSVSPKLLKMSLIKFFKDVFPALPVIAIIALIFFSQNKPIQKFSFISTLMTLFPCFLIFDETIKLAPFFNASLTNLRPSVFCPLIVRNKFFFYYSCIYENP